MNIAFTELDENIGDAYNESNNESNNNKYWENTKTTPEQKKKKRVTYDDILTSLNLVVHNGVLQYMDINPNTLGITSNDNSQQSMEPSRSILKNKGEVQNNVAPQLKNSYIYNKYFKDFKDPNIVEEPVKPMTREEYKQKVIQDIIHRNMEKKRIEQIKSKKMMFTNNNNTISNTIHASRNNLNHLFRVRPPI